MQLQPTLHILYPIISHKTFESTRKIEGGKGGHRSKPHWLPSRVASHWLSLHNEQWQPLPCKHKTKEL